MYKRSTISRMKDKPVKLAIELRLSLLFARNVTFLTVEMSHQTDII